MDKAHSTKGSYKNAYIANFILKIELTPSLEERNRNI
jgi:hypothetical protein